MSAHRLLQDLYLDGTPHAIPDPGDAGTFVIDRQFAVCKLVSAGAETRTLGDPKFAGQRLFLYMETDGGDITLTASSPVDQADNTVLTFDDAGDWVDLVGVDQGAGTTDDWEWRVVAGEGVSGYETATGTGAVNGSTVSASEQGSGDVVHKTVLTLTNHATALTDEAGVVAYGGSKIYDFPAGAILFLGAVSDLDLTLNAAGVNANWDGDFGLGTVTASNNNTLASTEQNILPSTATPQASASATTANGQSTATENAVVDGTSTAVDLYLNYLVDDADHDVGSTATAILSNGTITVHWINLGDY